MKKVRKIYDWIKTFLVVIPVLGIMYIWEILTDNNSK